MIYLDNAATTAPRPEVIEAMTRCLRENWGNPSSVHAAGVSARTSLEESRRAVMRTLGVRRETEGRILFTSGGTEADFLAVTGSVYAKRRPAKNGSRGKILSTDSEHPAVEEPLKRLEADGFTVVRIPTRRGVLDMDAIRENAEDVILATFMLVNNEHGALYDLAPAFRYIRAASPEAVLHTDAVQGFGKVKCNPAALGADLITLSAHKIGGPKGVGALYVSAPIFRAKKLIAMVPGGGQEDGFRGGTENMPGIVGFGEACRLAEAEQEENAAAVCAVREQIVSGIAAMGDDVRLNEPAAHIPHTLSLTVFGVRSEVMLNHLNAAGICVSAGSACSARARHISRAMQAFGLSAAEADSTIRISLSPDNTPQEAEQLLEAIRVGIGRLKKNPRT